MNNAKNAGKTLKIAVYCSASENLAPGWIDAARRLGAWIGATGATLVYGGVDAGLMRVVARAASDAGAGSIVGVVPAKRSGMASPFNDVVVPAEDLADRKSVMQLMADVFVVLPGGYGTLDEFLSALAFIRFNGLRDKSIILYNPGGLYDPLLRQFDDLIACGLMDPACLDSVCIVSSSDELIDRLDCITQN